jgi:hypothetical protein
MELRVHLKVCEGCGCLWYRVQTESGVYCSSCCNRFKEFPTPQSRKRSGRPRKLTLPTVFAVHASAHSELDFPLNDTRCFPATYEEIRNPLLGNSSPASAVLGGAQ